MLIRRRNKKKQNTSIPRHVVKQHNAKNKEKNFKMIRKKNR